MPEPETSYDAAVRPRSPLRSSTRRAIVAGRVDELENKNPRWRQNWLNAIGDQRLT